MRAECVRLGLDFIPVHTYNLSSTKDRAALGGLSIDILIVAGWQRLIPDWLIAQCRIGAIGGHGSPWGITAGRGRSPQNWALILQEPAFEISIFFIDAGADSGPVIATRRFPYTPTDDIETSYLKAVLLTAEMIVQNLKNPEELRRRAVVQKGTPAYLPKRIPQDGAIDWNRPAQAVCAFVAALTRPYPGAFTTWRGEKILIWHARPLVMDMDCSDHVPGRIRLITQSEKFAIEAQDGLILIDEYKAPPGLTLETEMVLESADFPSQMRDIIARHESANPDQPLASQITKFLKK